MNMGIKTAKRKSALRRLATFTAALGMLTMSSGVALMVTAGPANAANKVGICHATSSDSKPYRFISVDDDSAKFRGHLMHREEPNKTWKSDGTFNGVAHQAGDPKPDLIGSYTDSDGRFHELDGVITADVCGGLVGLDEATATVVFTDPSCENENYVTYQGSGRFVTFSTTGGAVAPGSSVEVTAFANFGAEFEDGNATKIFTHTFAPAVNLEGPPCVIVEPPGEVTPGAPQFVDPTCDTDAGVVLPESTILDDEVEKSAVVETTDVDGVRYEVSGDIVPGGTVEVTASAIAPNVLAEGAQTYWTHTFATPENCDTVAPPEEEEEPTVVVAPPTQAVTPTLVTAGALPSAADLRGEQGLALLVAGMVMMVLAGGLGLVRPGGARS